MALSVREKIKEPEVKKNLYTLDFFNLTDLLQQLREEEFFYIEENAYYDGGCCICWDCEQMERLSISEEWIKLYKTYPITAIRMTFLHFITGEKRYLYIGREINIYRDRNVIWLSQREDDFLEFPQKRLRSAGVLPVFDTLLSSMECKKKFGIFHNVNLKKLQDMDSFYAFLYQNGYVQLREVWTELKKDKYEEKSLAWAGEFIKMNDWNKDEREHLYFAIFKREFEEWDSTAGTDGCHCVWKDACIDVYAARSRTALDCLVIEGEDAMRLKPINMAEELYQYLEQFSLLDEIIKINGINHTDA